jgi:hypothetical protein
LTKVKFYQSKRLGFTKISSLVTLEFDLVFYIFFADLTINSVVFTEFQKIRPDFLTLVAPARVENQ